MRQRPDVLRQAGASPTRTGLEEGGADPTVEAHALHHPPGVAAAQLAHLGHGVHERQAQCQIGVAGVLDELCGSRVGPDDGSIDAREEPFNPIPCLRGPRSDDDPVGGPEAGHGPTDLEEFGIAHDVHVIPSEPGRDGIAGSDRNGGLEDDRRAGRHDLSEGVRDILHDGEVRRAVGRFGCRNAHVGDVRPLPRASEVAHEGEAASFDAGDDELLEVGFEERRASGMEQVEPVGVGLHAEYLGPEVGEAGRRVQADIAASDYDHRRSIDITHDAQSPWGTRNPAIRSSRRRTPKPVPPLVSSASSPSAKAGPAMSRCAQGMSSPTNSARMIPAVSAPA